MNSIIFKVSCDDCGGDACIVQLGKVNEVIIEFFEDVPFVCDSCGAESYLNIEKRVIK